MDNINNNNINNKESIHDRDTTTTAAGHVTYRPRNARSSRSLPLERHTVASSISSTYRPGSMAAAAAAASTATTTTTHSRPVSAVVANPAAADMGEASTIQSILVEDDMEDNYDYDYYHDNGRNDPVQRKGEEEEKDFAGWITSELLGLLGTAAGLTLSTTGKIVAPPLMMTKAVLLPALIALTVDTLDAITPAKVQDWFRIVTSSVYHLMVVLGNTERGKIFSAQCYVVLQDLLLAVSAPEARQVLIDGMASTVKFADALNTPEVQEWLEQLSILSVRILDAISSGKAKLLLQDSKDLAWKGVEMVTDPATTLALAEVTAHLCHALEDTHTTLTTNTRSTSTSVNNNGATASSQAATTNTTATSATARRFRRNAQNQSVYLNHYQMSGFPEQVTMEEVILSCLGVPMEMSPQQSNATTTPTTAAAAGGGSDGISKVPNAEKKEDKGKNGGGAGGKSIRSKVMESTTSTRQGGKSRGDKSTENDGSTVTTGGSGHRIWKERGEQVNVKLLREKILKERSRHVPTKPINQDDSTTKANDAQISKDQQQPRHIPKAEEDLEKTKRVAHTIAADNVGSEEDIEDIRWSRIRGGLRSIVDKASDNHKGELSSAVAQFYKTLDEFMEKNRMRYSAAQPMTTEKNGHLGQSRNIDKNVWSRNRRAAALRNFQREPYHPLLKKHRTLVQAIAVLLLCVFLIFTGFAFYGMYAWAKRGQPTTKMPSSWEPSSSLSNNQEIVIRIVREVVQVSEDGTVLGQSPGGAVTQAELDQIAASVDRIAQNVAMAMKK